uniref:Uncharacterized protein n=1 Tax=Macrostomum lignano TaxID=282301 RepID=A0A1I8GRR2_9PLAT
MHAPGSSPSQSGGACAAAAIGRNRSTARPALLRQLLRQSRQVAGRHRRRDRRERRRLAECRVALLRRLRRRQNRNERKEKRKEAPGASAGILSVGLVQPARRAFAPAAPAAQLVEVEALPVTLTTNTSRSWRATCSSWRTSTRCCAETNSFWTLNWRRGWAILRIWRGSWIVVRPGAQHLRSEFPSSSRRSAATESVFDFPNPSSDRRLPTSMTSKVELASSRICAAS